MRYYVHREKPAVFESHPIDSRSTDWFYFTVGGVFDSNSVRIFESSLADDEIVTHVDALVDNGTKEAPVAEFDTVQDSVSNDVHHKVYAVLAKPDIASHGGQMGVTLIYTTNFGRADIVKSIGVPVIDQ